MKKNISKLGILLVLALFFLMAVGSGSAETKKNIVDTDEISENNETAEDTEESKDSDLKEDKTESKLETINEEVLFEKDGIRVTAKELVNDPIWGKGINVLIENNSDKNVGVQCNTLIVNNYMITDLFSSSIAAGKKDNEVIELSSSALEAAGIDTISEINISFHVFDDESFDTLFDTEEVSIKTSAYGTVEQPAVDDGKELFNQGGIRIVGKYVSEDSFWGAGVLLFIENTSKEDILVQCDDMSINGFMVSPFFSSQVNKGRMALDTITILSSDLEENGIEEVKDLELKFNIIDPVNYDTISESESITFSVNE